MIFIVGIISGFLTMFLNYCMGKPGSEFSPYEIFSFYTVWLSERRLKKVGLFQTYADQAIESAKRAKAEHELIDLKNGFKKIIYNAAEPFFTWERMIGMCPVCFGFWVSLIVSICFTLNIVYIATIIVTSHIVIRLLSKII